MNGQRIADALVACFCLALLALGCGLIIAECVRHG